MSDEFRKLMEESRKRCISGEEAADIFVSIGTKPIDLPLPQISIEDKIAIKFREFIRSFDDEGIQIDPEEVAIFVANYLYKNGIKQNNGVSYFTSEIPLFDIFNINKENK